MKPTTNYHQTATNYQPPATKPKVALVCDWLTNVGGAEQVVLELHKLFPDAPIYTSQYNPKSIDWFQDADVRTGWLQHFPSALKKFLPVLRAWYFSKLDLSEYDIIISSAGAEAKAIQTNKNQTHICYMHAPTHYYWSRYEDYLRNPGFPRGLNWLARLGLKLLVSPMRRWDFRAAQQPDHIIANSSHTQTAIREYYKRESTVIHPPVDIDFFAADEAHPPKRSGFIITGRQTPYKRFDLAVAACTQLGLPLKVVGDGPEHETLKEAAGSNVAFLGHVSRKELRELLRSSEAFLFPGEDDFGIAPVEALAVGTPVIAYEAGGALDYIEPGVNGEFFFPQTIEALTHTLREFKATDYSSKNIQPSSNRFTVEKFEKHIQDFVKNIVKIT